MAFVQLSALALGVAWLARGAGDAGHEGRPIDLALVAFLAWSAASLAGAEQPSAGLATLGHWSACALAYVVVSRTARPADVPRLGAALLLGGAAAAAVGLGQALFALGLVPQAAAPAATLANRNVAAGYLVLVAPLALLPWPGRVARAAAWAGAAAMLAFLPFTRSRTAAVAVAVQLALVATLREGARRPGRGARRALLAAGVAAVAVAGWLSVADAAKARSSAIRLDLAATALAMALDHPLRGVGLGGFGAHYPRYGPVVASSEGAPLRVESPHAEGLQVLAETGLPGLLAALWVAGAALHAVRRVRRSLEATVRRAGLAVGLSLAGFAVDAALGFPARCAVPPLVVAVLLGLLASPALAGSLAPARPARAAWPARLVPAALVVVVAGTAATSLRRLEGDRVPYRAAFLPVAHAAPSPGASCAPGVALDPRADGTIDLRARGVPLADVLRCLVEHTGLKIDYDGPAPRQPVSVALHEASLTRTLEALLEGLGVNYLLSRDPETGADRLMVFAAGRGSEPSRGGASPSTGAASSVEPAPAEPVPADETTPFGAPPPGAPGEMAFPGAPVVPGPPPPGDVPAPEAEPEPPPFEPAELTPMTLQLGRPPRPAASPQTSAVRRFSISVEGV
jgi:O-antigen ligase